MKNIHFTYLILLLTVLFASCEKGIDTAKVDSTVYLVQSGLTTQTVLLGNSEFSLGIYKAGINQKNPRVTVTLGMDQEAGTEFIANNPGYEMLPSGFYTLPEQNVIIGKGSDREFYHINFKGIDETFTNKKYILPISITAVDNDAKLDTTRNLAILQFSRFRNAYEASYKSYGQAAVSGTTDLNLQKIDEVITSTSIDANTIKVKGPVSGLNLLLTVQSGEVLIKGAPGSEAFNVQNTSGKKSSYSGTFNEVYQRNNELIRFIILIPPLEI
jgi:hypothetical protein